MTDYLEDCIHGLDPRTCSTCLHGIEPVKPPEEAVYTIKARFDSWCPECHRKVEEGDDVTVTTRDRWVHPECVP